MLKEFWGIIEEFRNLQHYSLYLKMNILCLAVSNKYNNIYPCKSQKDKSY